jgi:hypothetical protein
MQAARLFRVGAAVLYVTILFAAQGAQAQTKSAAPQIVVYESPT